MITPRLKMKNCKIIYVRFLWTPCFPAPQFESFSLFCLVCWVALIFTVCLLWTSKWMWCMCICWEDIHVISLFCESGERLEKRSTELTSLSNEISSLVDNQILLIQDLEKMSSNQVISIGYENVYMYSISMYELM